MNVVEYKLCADKTGFVEYPLFITGFEKPLKSFVDFEKTELDLKIYLAKLIICRCFLPTGGIYWPNEPIWFISNAVSTFSTDTNRPWNNVAINSAIRMILKEDNSREDIIGTVFMFGIVEFYSKTLLGWNPDSFDFFDSVNQNKYRDMYIGNSINKLKKNQTDLAISLNEIDKHNLNFLKETGIKEQRYTKAKIADRLSLARNPMVHGEAYRFYDKGMYLAMLYLLFYYHDLKIQTQYEA